MARTDVYMPLAIRLRSVVSGEGFQAPVTSSHFAPKVLIIYFALFYFVIRNCFHTQSIYRVYEADLPNISRKLFMLLEINAHRYRLNKQI